MAIIIAIREAREIDALHTFSKTKEPRVLAYRHAAWKALRAKKEKGRRIYTAREIASWWNVTHPAVLHGTKTTD